jgi:hypothetical protein
MCPMLRLIRGTATTMRQWTALLLGMLAVAAFGVALVGTCVKGPNGARRPAAATPLPSTSGSGPSLGTVLGRASSDAEFTDASRPDGQPLDAQPDSGPVPPLPPRAPRSVTIGVIQFAYRGAELAPEHAPTKAEASQKARSILELAIQDFARAVPKGDRGSGADIGEVPQGILEPAIEYVLFTMEAGSVHEAVLDTPRGYWIVRRIR